MMISRNQLNGDLASGVAHDLNNQLTVIVNHLDFAMNRLDPDHPVRGNLDDVIRAANRCTQMVDDLIQPLKPVRRFRRMDLGPVIHETHRLLLGMIPVRIRLTFRVEPLVPVMADPTRVQQVLLNLVINARDAISRSGTIHVGARMEEGRILLSVRDSGSGIPDGVLERVFEPRFTTKGDRGNGLGLAMAQSTVQEHGGTITVTSEPGRGTCFVVALPACD